MNTQETNGCLWHQFVDDLSRQIAHFIWRIFYTSEFVPAPSQQPTASATPNVRIVAHKYFIFEARCTPGLYLKLYFLANTQDLDDR